MITIEEDRSTVPSSLVDLSGIPLEDMSALSEDLLERAIGRVLPEAPAVPVAAFQSSI